MPPIPNMNHHPNKKEEKEEAIESFTLTKSMMHSIVFTFIVVFLYYYKRFLRRNSETHEFKVFAIVLASSMILFSMMRNFVPEFYRSTISGVGWGLGMTLIKHVLLD